jgi:acetyl-CoA acetyltransferase
MTLQDKVAVVGLGLISVAPGEDTGLGVGDLAILAAEAALTEAGLGHKDLENFAWSSGAGDPGSMAATMGVPEVMFAANLTSGGGGGAGALALAASSIVGGFGDVCLSIVAAQPAPKRPAGTSSVYQPNPVAGGGAYAGGMVQAQPEDAFTAPASISSQGATISMIANRYLHEHGVPREHLGAVVVTQRANAGDSLTIEEYLRSPLIVGPLSALDGTPDLEGGFAAAVITTTVERARDLAQPPILITAAATGGTPSHATAFQMPQDTFGSSGHRAVAADLYAMAGMGPDDIDVALLYDDFSPMVLMQLEDYGFCGAGEGGAFVAGGNTQARGGKIPVNTHGGNLSSAYVRGITHVFEAVQQLRGTATNQVDGAQFALVTGSPATIPLSAVILRKA